MFFSHLRFTCLKLEHEEKDSILSFFCAELLPNHFVALLALPLDRLDLRGMGQRHFPHVPPPALRQGYGTTVEVEEKLARFL